MGKFCKTYKVPCACVTCYGVDCAQSPKTQGEAEIIRGVKLARDGTVLEEVHGLSSTPGLGTKRDVAKKEGLEQFPPPEIKPDAKSAATGTTPLQPGQSLSVAESALLRQLEGKPSARRKVYAGAVVVLGAVACAGVLLLGTYYLVDLMRPKPEPQGDVVASVPRVVEEPAAAEPEAAPTPIADLPAETKTLQEVVADVEASASSLPPLPSVSAASMTSAKEELAKQVKQLKEEGNAEVKNGNFAGARTSYQAAVEADPLYYEGWNNLANTYNDEGKQAEAEPIYKRGLAIEPESASLRFNLGNSHFRAKRYKDALNEFNVVLEQNPNDIDAHLLAGIAHYKLGEFAEASKHFQTVTVINPENADGYYNMALALRRQGQDALARVYYRDAIRLNPGLRTVARN
ncbi:tetratricopeptide repeat protein [Candidatus Sumerlaeota bacterium]|nr:tetratricopeptide repeat protein [Candidatus Sumerlaeota bacterium]